MELNPKALDLNPALLRAAAALLPAHYARSAPASILSASTEPGRRSLLTPADLAMDLGGSAIAIPQGTVDLNLAANWDSAYASYATAENRAGKDVYLYATPSRLILSPNATVPTGYTAANSRKIGGFHCLCLSAGSISGHTLTDFLTGDILPASIWDLNWRPVCLPRGMVYSAAANVWVDIYLQSGTGLTTASVFGATITDTRDYWSHGDDLAAVGKRMLLDMEFSQIAYGSPEGTNIMGSADPVTTGGHVNTALTRIISHCGCEDCTGVMYQWCDGGYVYRNDDASYSGAWSWKSAGSRGQQYTQGSSGAGGLPCGGSWGNGPNCGSRSRRPQYLRSYTGADVGCRGCATSLFV